MPSRLFLFAVTFLLVIDSVSWARIWTGKNGRQIEGKFIRVTQGNVIIRSRNRTWNVPAAILSRSDHEFLRFQLLSKEKKTRLLEEINSHEMRVWTMRNGQQLSGVFFRFFEGHVTIYHEEDFHAISYEYLLGKDQDYVRTLLEAKGLDELLAAVDDSTAVDDTTVEDGEETREGPGLVAIQPPPIPPGAESPDVTENGSVVPTDGAQLTADVGASTDAFPTDQTTPPSNPVPGQEPAGFPIAPLEGPTETVRPVDNSSRPATSPSTFDGAVDGLKGLGNRVQVLYDTDSPSMKYGGPLVFAIVTLVGIAVIFWLFASA